MFESEAGMHITWDTYTEELRTFIQRRIENPLDAEDVLQDVLLKAYRQQHQLNDANSVRAWLYQIARHTIIDFYRLQRAQLVPLDAYAELLPESTAEQDIDVDIIRCVVSLVDALPDKYRAALVAADLYEIPQHVLSDQLGLSYSGTKSRVQRGREKLRQLLEERCHTEVAQYHAMHIANPCCLPQDTCCA